MIRLVLPLPPSANRYYRRVGAKTLLSKDAREYRAACRLAAVAQYGGPLLEGRVKIEAHVYMSLQGDLDNRIKQCLDALEGSVIADDRQVWECRFVRHLDRERPRLEASVEEIEG